MHQTIQQFTSSQIMTAEDMEFFHYQDIRFGKVRPHMHSHYEFYFFLDGTTRYSIEQKRYMLEKGDFLIIPPDTLHFPEVLLSESDRPYERFVLWVSKDYFEQILNHNPALKDIWQHILEEHSWHYRPKTEDFQHIQTVMTELMLERESHLLGADLAMEGLFYQLFILMSRISQNRSAKRAYSQSKDLYSDIINYIHQNIRASISIKDLSTTFYVSASYISKLFRQHLGISVHQYILRVKTERILEEAAGGASFTTASFDYGFSNYSSFYRQCMREYHLSPSELLDTD